VLSCGDDDVGVDDGYDDVLELRLYCYDDDDGGLLDDDWLDLEPVLEALLEPVLEALLEPVLEALLVGELEPTHS